MAKRATYVKTNCPTTEVKEAIKNRINIMGLLVVIAYRNRDKWLTLNDFIAEAAKDGVILTDKNVSAYLIRLSGYQPGLLPSYQRNELKRKGSKMNYLYRFNVRGTIRIRGALGFTRVENITKARFVAFRIKTTEE